MENEKTTNYQLGSNTVDAILKASPVEKQNGISYEDWYEMVRIARIQRDLSREFKRTRMEQIRKGENMYFGIVPKQYKNPYNYCLPYVSGFVDQLMAEIQEPPRVLFTENRQEDYSLAQRTTALFEQQISSLLPYARWGIKDRHSKKLAIFSGVGILKFHTQEINGNFRAVLNVVDHYDFHCEPNGGSDLENHLFCGEDGIFKTARELRDGIEAGYYNREETKRLLESGSSEVYKQNADEYYERNNRSRAMGLDPETYNYVGVEVAKLTEWYLNFKGHRYYMLIDFDTNIAPRIQRLDEMVSLIEPYDRPLYPYVAWHTHEDPKVFWSKAPIDDIVPVGETINLLWNQELYNRDKQNTGTRLYDPKMVTDIEALTTWRTDNIIPVQRTAGQSLTQAVQRVDVGTIGGTESLIQFLNQFGGEKSGVTPGSQGQAPSSQKVGIFYGEMQQISKRLSVYNSSYKEAWAMIGLRFRAGLNDHVTNDIAVKLEGAKGVEWTWIKSEDFEGVKDFDITVEGGSDSDMRKKQEALEKVQVLNQVKTVNPKWADKERLLAVGYTEEQVMEAFSIQDPETKELLAEAARAEREIVEGGNPKINMGATVAFIQHIMDFAKSLSMKDEEEELQVKAKLMEYASMHTAIVLENENRKAEVLLNEMRTRRLMQGGGALPVGGGSPPAGGSVELLPNSGQSAEIIQNNPTGGAIGVGQEITNSMTP